ncbi:S1C family serine protease [uncultured Friedmanniella sp.]|uniref:S1C family serine protease n=1 Tax=uncultured Friedmanniella sp. TaxID=335381 RepID=UPI0035CC0808
MVKQRGGFRRVRVGLATAVLAVGVGIGGVPAEAATVPRTVALGTVALADWSNSSGYGSGDPWGGSGQGGYGQGSGSGSGSGSSTADVDSTTATKAEQRGVVLIDTELTYEGATGAGTGIVLTSDGEIVTNYHVVEGATSIKVTVASTGRTYTATVVGHSASTDIALLQLKDASGLTTATLDDDTLGSGDTVTAVGNAEGTGTLTAAKGKVSDLSTSITTEAEGSVPAETLKGLIETSADVVPGDSGGPLIDSEGEVVGLDVAASSGTTSATIDGYAIPIDDAIAVVKQILTGTATSTVQIGARAYVGVQVTDTATTYPNASYGGYSTGSSAGSAGEDASGAAVAAVVDGSPAAKAGIEAGDTITGVGSTTIGSASDLSTALAKYGVGDEVKVTWTDASGTTQHATVTLAASPTA